MGYSRRVHRYEVQYLSTYGLIRHLRDYNYKLCNKDEDKTEDERPSAL